VSSTPAFSLANGKYRLLDGPLAVEIDPTDGGRMTELSLDGANVLVVRGAAASHGSSFWPSPQRDWDWPPPAELDREPWRATLADGALSLESGVSRVLELSALQRVTPAPHGVRIEHRFHNHGPAARAVAPWRNSRVGPRGLTFYPSPAATLDGSTLKLAPTDDGITWLAHDPATMTENAKSFGDGAEGWLAHVDGRGLFLMTFPKVPRAAQAPTEAEIELYVDRTGLFVEVEQQGAYEPVAPGATSEPWTVRFQLHALPSGVPALPGAALVSWVRGLVASSGSV
jgi:hypothetical protein